MLQKLQARHNHSSDMQEEPIDFSLTAFKKRKQPWHFPSKSQSPSSKRDSASLTLAERSVPSISPPLDSSQRDFDNIDGQGSDKSQDGHSEEIRSLDANRHDTDNRERWLSPALSVKTGKDIVAGKANRSRKGTFKKGTDNERLGSVASKMAAVHGEVVPIKRAMNTFSLSGNRHMASTSAVYKTSTGVSFVSQPSQEYEQIESCETRGLKLTFRRRSTEKSQQIVKDKALKSQQDIPKLIVSKCKKAQGYSLHNGKNEKECKCSSSVALKEPGHETEILSLPESPKIDTEPQPLLSGKTVHTINQILKETTATSSHVKDTTMNENLMPINCRIKARDELKELQQCSDNDAVLNSVNCLDEEVNKEASLLTSRQWEETDGFHAGDSNPQPGKVSGCQGIDTSSCQDIGTSSCQDIETSSCQDMDTSSCQDIDTSSCHDIDTSSCHDIDTSSCPVTGKTSAEEALPAFQESIEHTSPYHNVYLHKDIDNQEGETRFFSEQAKCQQHETSSCSQYKEVDSVALGESQCTEQDLEIRTEVTLENIQANEKEQTPNTGSIITASKANTSNTTHVSRRVKLCKSESEGWYLPIVDPDAITHSRRSESAPPTAQSLDGTLLSVHGVCRETSRSKSLDIASSKPTNHQAHNNRNTEPSLDEPDRPSSSPPACSSTFSTEGNHGRKSPVVLLDRLPSPVIELYSMRCSNHSHNDHNDSLSDDQVSSGEWSAYSEYDSENAKSSGKLRFTYRKVNRGRSRNLKTTFRAGDHSRPSCSRSRDFLQNDDEEDMFKNKGKKRSRPLQRRKQYGRASKRRIRYVNDDDEYGEDTGAIEHVDDRILEKDGSAENNEHVQEIKWNKNTTAGKCGQKFDSRMITENGNVMLDSNHHSLVDPRIKPMSTALLNACKNNQNAEKIAFKGKIIPRPLSRNEPLKQRQKYSSQILKKASRAVDNIRKHFSKSGTTYTNNCKEKQHGKHASEVVNRSRHPVNIQNGWMVRSLKDIGRHSNLVGKTSYPRHPTPVLKRCSDDTQNAGTAIYPNRYRNVFESDVFQLPTNGSSQSWSQLQNNKSPKTNNISEKISKSRVKSALSKWAFRRARGGKVMRLLSREATYESSLKAHCCKCRCRCQNNDDELAGRKLLQKKMDTPASFRDPCSPEEPPTKVSLELCELDVRVKPECPDLAPETSETSGIFKPATVKREISSPTLQSDPYANANGLTEEVQTCDLAQVKIEITKDTDLMGLDYSQPKHPRSCSKTFDDMKVTNGPNTSSNTTTIETSATEESTEHHKTWDRHCRVSQSATIVKDNDTSFLSEQVVPCSSIIRNEYPLSSTLNQSSVSTSERPMNVSSKSCDSQSYQLSTTTTTSVPTPLYLFTNQVTSRAACSAFPLPNFPSCSLASSYLPTLTLNTPLSIQIGNSPGNSEYGSPPNLTEYSSPGYGASNGLSSRSNTLQVLNQFYQSNQTKHPVPCFKMSISQGHLKKFPCDLAVEENPQKKTSKHGNHSSKLPMTVPKISISSPSSLCSKDQVTPSAASPTGTTHSFFISPDLPRQAQVKSISRSSSPFRSPSTLLSPYKSPTRATADFHKSAHSNTHKHTSDIGSSKMKPQTGYSLSSQRNYQSLQLPKMGNRLLSNPEEYESDDSDATLAYPTADPDNKRMHSKARIPSRRSSIGLSSTCFSEGSCISALSSPNLKDEDKNSSMLSPSDNLERKRSELSLIVSDLRENISKTKAMKRNRRTNSFSGENQQSISDAHIASKATAKRASFERFMSVEPLMDSDTPYARLTQDLVSVDEEDNKHFAMLRFVSGLRLKPTSRREPLESSLSPDDMTDRQSNYFKYEQSDCNAAGELRANILEEHKYNTPQEEAPESSELPTDHISELQTTFKQENNSDNTQTTYDDGCNKPDSNDNDDDDDDDNPERPLVVIENAESDEVIEGDEAFHKMSSGTYNLPTGTVNQPESRASKTKASFRGKRLRISMKSLFTRKSPTKSKSFVKSTKEACLKHREKSVGSGYKFNRRTARNICHVHQKRAQGKKRNASPDSAHDSKDAVCDCQRGKGSELADNAVGTATKRRRKHSDVTTSAVSKPNSPDPLVEQLNQNSAARILQELPRYNWLEQKILQRTAYNQSPGSANSNSPQSQSSRGTSNRSPNSPDTNAKPKPISAQESVLMTRNSTVSKKSHDGDDGKGERVNPPTAENVLHKDELSLKQPVADCTSVTAKKTEDGLACMKLGTTPETDTVSAPTLKLEVSVVDGDELEGFEINIPSPDDGNDEHNLTIDLTGVDDTEMATSTEFVDLIKAPEPTSPQCDSSGSTDTDAHDDWLDKNKNSVATSQKTKGALNLPPGVPNNAHATTDSPLSVSVGSGVLSSVRPNTSKQLDDQPKSGGMTDTFTGPTQESSLAQPQLCTAVTTVVGTATQSTVTLSSSSIKQEVILLTSSSLSQVGESERLAEIPSDNLSGSASDSAVGDKSGNDSKYCGVVGLPSLGTKTTTTVTATAASASSATTTTTSSKVTGLLEAETPAPLDLCLKKSESLTTTSCRTKGNPPVQMVLPQVQHKLAISLPQSGFTTVSQVTTVEVKAGGKSGIHGLEMSENLDLTESVLPSTGITKAHHITSKPTLGSDLKVERCYPLHSDTLDLCIKSSGLSKSSATDNLVDDTSHQRHHHNNEPLESSEMEENISIGLALSAELETERERDISSRLIINEGDSSVDAFMESNSNDAAVNFASELLDIPISLTSSYQTAKSMTDAELDQEFQKHLIEFKALEKLAERKAQEQMQVAIMRKRKAEMLRIMEMKKAKRDLDRVGQITSRSRDSEKSTASKSNPLTLKTFSPAPASSAITSYSLSSPATPKTFSSTSALMDLGIPTSSCPNFTTKLSTVLFSKFDQAFPCPQLSCDTKAIDSAGTKLPTSTPLAPAQIKKENADYNENESIVDLRFQDPHIPSKECKIEIMDTECKGGSECHSVNTTLKCDIAVESPREIFEEKSTFRDNQTSDHQTTKSVQEQTSSDPSANSTPQKAQLDNESQPVPAPAHQTQPMSLPLDKTDCSQPNKVYMQGPYYRRNIAINEPPYMGKEAPKDEVLKKAHIQRPFQTSGNLSLSERQTPVRGSPRMPGNDSTSGALIPRSGTYSGCQVSDRTILPRPVGEGIAYRDIKGSERPASHSDGIESHKKVLSEASTVESVHVRTQRKSLDESELNRSVGPSVTGSGSRSADDVNKVQHLFQSLSPISNKMFVSRANGQSGTPPNLEKQVLSQRQQHQMQLQHAVPPVLTLQAPNGKSNYISEEEEKRNAFKVHHLPQNNQVVDLTCENMPSKVKTTPSLYPSQPAYIHHPSTTEGPPGSDDPSQYSRHDPAGRSTQSLTGNNSQKSLGSADLMPTFFHIIRSDRETSSLPNGFNNDRSRPGGFITNKQRSQSKEPAQPLPVKDTGFFKEHIRPSMPSVTHNRQRYKSNNPLEPHLPSLAQSGLNISYHKPIDDMALRFQGHTGPIVWSDEQPTAGVEFFATNQSVPWRGPSPITSTHSGPGKEMFNDVSNIGSRTLVDDIEKQRGRSEIHPAFHSPSDLVYKQQNQLEMDLLISHSIPGMSSAFSSASAIPISSLHSNSSSLRQQPMMAQNYPQRSSHMSSQSQSAHNSFVRQQVPQDHFQSQQQQQQQQQSPLCQHQPVEMTPASWRSFGNADSCSISAANAQSRPSYSQNQQLSSGQSIPGVHHDTLAYQKMQQQQYQMHQMQQGRPAHKLMVAPSGTSPVQSMSLVQGNHTSSGHAPPQLLFGDCSRLPTYSNMSPTATQTSSLMMPQNRSFHHAKASDTEHITMMHQQRQQPKLPLYDQRPRMPQQSQALSGIPSSTAPLTSLAGLSRTGGTGAFGPLGPASGSSIGPTNSVCRVCGKVAVFLCSSCRRVWYCNQQCQTKHWSVHATECKPLS